MNDKKNNLLNRPDIFGDGLRFIVVGLGNTLFTFVVFQLLLFKLSPLLSYYLSWAIGFTLLLVAFPHFVFKGSSLTTWRALLTFVIYLSSMVLGGFLLRTLHLDFGLNPRFGVILTIIFTTAFNFSASRLVFRFFHSITSD